MGNLVRFTVSWVQDYNDCIEALNLDTEEYEKLTPKEIKKLLAEQVADTFIEDMQWVSADDINVILPVD